LPEDSAQCAYAVVQRIGAALSGECGQMR